MKANNIKTRAAFLSLLVAVVCALPSCKKDKASLNRISKVWVMKDPNAGFNNNTSVCKSAHSYKKSTFEFRKDGKYRFVHTFVKNGIENKCEETGDWNFFNRKTEIKIKGVERLLDPSDNHVVEENATNYLWKISKLEEDEFWVSSLAISPTLEEFKFRPQ